MEKFAGDPAQSGFSGGSEDRDFDTKGRVGIPSGQSSAALVHLSRMAMNSAGHPMAFAAKGLDEEALRRQRPSKHTALEAFRGIVVPAAAGRKADDAGEPQQVKDDVQSIYKSPLLYHTVPGDTMKSTPLPGLQHEFSSDSPQMEAARFQTPVFTPPIHFTQMQQRAAFKRENGTGGTNEVESNAFSYAGTQLMNNTQQQGTLPWPSSVSIVSHSQSSVTGGRYASRMAPVTRSPSFPQTVPQVEAVGDKGDPTATFQSPQTVPQLSALEPHTQTTYKGEKSSGTTRSQSRSSASPPKVVGSTGHLASTKSEFSTPKLQQVGRTRPTPEDFVTPSLPQKSRGSVVDEFATFVPPFRSQKSADAFTTPALEQMSIRNASNPSVSARKTFPDTSLRSLQGRFTPKGFSGDPLQDAAYMAPQTGSFTPLFGHADRVADEPWSQVPGERMHGPSTNGSADPLHTVNEGSKRIVGNKAATRLSHAEQAKRTESKQNRNLRQVQGVKRQRTDGISAKSSLEKLTQEYWTNMNDNEAAGNHALNASVTPDVRKQQIDQNDGRSADRGDRTQVESGGEQGSQQTKLAETFHGPPAPQVFSAVGNPMQIPPQGLHPEYLKGIQHQQLFQSQMQSMGYYGKSVAMHAPGQNNFQNQMHSGGMQNSPQTSSGSILHYTQGNVAYNQMQARQGTFMGTPGLPPTMSGMFSPQTWHQQQHIYMSADGHLRTPTLGGFETPQLMTPQMTPMMRSLTSHQIPADMTPQTLAQSQTPHQMSPVTSDQLKSYRGSELYFMVPQPTPNHSGQRFNFQSQVQDPMQTEVMHPYGFVRECRPSQMQQSFPDQWHGHHSNPQTGPPAEYYQRIDWSNMTQQSRERFLPPNGNEAQWIQVPGPSFSMSKDGQVNCSLSGDAAAKERKVNEPQSEYEKMVHMNGHPTEYAARNMAPMGIRANDRLDGAHHHEMTARPIAVGTCEPRLMAHGGTMAKEIIYVPVSATMGMHGTSDGYAPTNSQLPPPSQPVSMPIPAPPSRTQASKGKSAASSEKDLARRIRSREAAVRQRQRQNEEYLRLSDRNATLRQRVRRLEEENRIIQEELDQS